MRLVAYGGISMDDAAYFQALPKAELHLHLDGSVRPKTVLELAAQGGVPVPTQDLERLTDYLQATDSTASLVEYITYFELPIAVLQTVPALERATYELCEDLKKDNVRYAEIRYGPWLHVQQGLSLTDVIRAVLSGWKAGRKSFGLEGGIIVTALRDMPPAPWLRRTMPTSGGIFTSLSRRTAWSGWMASSTSRVGRRSRRHSAR